MSTTPEERIGFCHHCQGTAEYSLYADRYTCDNCGSIWWMDGGERTDYFVSAKAMELAQRKCLWDGTRENLLQRAECPCTDCQAYLAEGCGIPG